MDRCGGIGSCRVGPLSWVSSRCAGQAGCGGWPLALEHEPVRLTDVTVSGNGGGLVEVRRLLLRLLISSH